MTRRLSSPVFVGRQPELERLRAAIERAVEGSPSLVVIGGEAGVGKSRLLDQLVAGLDPSRLHVLVGRCVDLGTGGIPYAPFVEAFRGLGVGRTPAELDRLLGRGRAELARIVPSLADGVAPPPVAPDNHSLAQGAFFEHLLGSLGRLAGDRPVLLVLEDLHWADSSTRDLLRFLARNLRAERVACVLSYRTDDLHRRHPLIPLLAELERLPLTERFTLEPFGAGELAGQLEGILGEPPDGAVVDRILARSDGNAFFVEELVAAGAADADVRLPETVHEILATRVARLGDESRQVMRVAALLGRQVSHRLLATIADLGEPALLDALRESVDAQLLVPRDDPADGGYEFRHTLVQECLADELLPTERTALHARIAAVLETERARRHGAASEIAHHWLAAHDIPKAFAASVRAAADAVELAAFADAHAQYERAIELWPAVAEPAGLVGMDHAALLDRTADAAASAGDLERAVVLADVALAELAGPDDLPRRLDVVHRAAWYRWDLGDATGAERLVLEALETHGAAPPAVQARLLSDLAHVHWSARRYAEQRDAAARAVALATEAGDRLELGRARIWLGTALGELGSIGDGLDLLGEAIALLGDGPDDLRTRTGVLLTHLLGDLSGTWERAEVQGRLEIDRAREAGMFGRYGPYLLANLLDTVVETGRYAEAERLLAQNDWPRDGNRASIWLYESSADVAIARDDLAAARASVSAARQLLGASAALIDGLWLDRTEASLARREGRLEAAREHLDRTIHASVDPVRDVSVQWILLAALRNEADIAIEAGARGDSAALEAARSRGRRAAELIEAFAANADPRSWERTLDALRATAAAERARLDGRPDPDAWARMALAARAVGRRPDEAYARFREAEALLLAGGSRGRAATALRETLRIAGEMGRTPIRTEAESLARRARIEVAPEADPATGTTAPPAPAGVPFGLTARELEVLSHVARGRTNREIGAALFISDKTASVHVTHILDKLGVNSRVEAALAAERLGLLEPSG